MAPGGITGSNRLEAGREGAGIPPYLVPLFIEGETAELIHKPCHGLSTREKDGECKALSCTAMEIRHRQHAGAG